MRPDAVDVTGACHFIDRPMPTLLTSTLCGVTLEEMSYRNESWMPELNNPYWPVTCPTCRNRAVPADRSNPFVVEAWLNA